MSRVRDTHNFHEKSYTRWTFCDHCNKLLWGVVKQGVECADCGFISHRRCLGHISYACDHLLAGLRNAGSEPGSESASLMSPEKEVTLTATLLHRRAAGGGSSSSLRKSASSENIQADKFASGPYLTAPAHRASASTNSLVQDLIVSTAANQIALSKSLKPPALNLLTTTPKNMTKFVSRLGPLSLTQDVVLEIFTWQRKSRTLLCMVGYATVCLHPRLILLAPFAILIYIILGNYFYRARQLAEATTSPGRRSPIPAALLRRPLQPSLAAIGSRDYFANLQFIQNHMGMYADAYDQFWAFMHHLDWTDENHTARILKLACIAMAVTFLATFIVPYNIILLVVGELGFIANTPLARAAADVVMPVVLERILGTAKRIQGGWTERRKTRMRPPPVPAHLLQQTIVKDGASPVPSPKSVGSGSSRVRASAVGEADRKTQ